MARPPLLSQEGTTFRFPLPNRNETLHALSAEYLTGIDVAARIHCDHVESEELAAVVTHATQRADNLAVIAVEKPNMVVRQIGNKQEPLRLIGREGHPSC